MSSMGCRSSQDKRGNSLVVRSTKSSAYMSKRAESSSSMDFMMRQVNHECTTRGVAGSR